MHPRFDTRIFHKMCVSLRKSGHDVSLVVADGKGCEERSGVKIFDVGAPRNRLDRFFRIAVKLMLLSRSLKPDLCHIHDPELMVFLCLLNRKSTKIFDFHEDVAAQIMRKEYLNESSKRLLSLCYGVVETLSLVWVDGIIGATDQISDKYRGTRPAETVCNFPKLSEFMRNRQTNGAKTKTELIYVGGLSKARGIQELVDAVSLLGDDVVLHLCGNFSPPSFESELVGRAGWRRVEYHGFLDRESIVSQLFSADVGIVTLLPDPSYMQSLPVKMFEYFAAKLPVVASDFPVWKTILQVNECGITVNPCDPKDIANGINKLLSEPRRMMNYGENGYRASLAKFNWANEYGKLEEFYSLVAGSR